MDDDGTSHSLAPIVGPAPIAGDVPNGSFIIAAPMPMGTPASRVTRPEWCAPGESVAGMAPEPSSAVALRRRVVDLPTATTLGVWKPPMHVACGLGMIVANDDANDVSDH